MSQVCRQCRWRRAWRCYHCSRNCDVSAAPSPPSTDAYGSTPSRSIIAEAMEGRSAMSTSRTTWPRLSMLRLVAMTASTNPLPGDLPFYQKTAQPNPKPEKSESSTKKDSMECLYGQHDGEWLSNIRTLLLRSVVQSQQSGRELEGKKR